MTKAEQASGQHDHRRDQEGPGVARGHGHGHGIAPRAVGGAGVAEERRRAGRGQRGQGGEAHRGADLAAAVDQARGQAGLLVGDAAGGQQGDGGEGQAHAEGGEDPAAAGAGPVGVAGLDEGEPEQAAGRRAARPA